MDGLTNSGSLKLEFYRLCTVCGDDVNAADKKIFYKLWAQHCESEQHVLARELKQLEKLRAKRAAKVPVARPEATSDKASFPFYRLCRVCGGEVAAREEPTFMNNWNQHVAGLRHRNALQSKPKSSSRADSKFQSTDDAVKPDMMSMTCKLCDHEVRGPTRSVLTNNFKQHVASPKHQRLLYEREQKKQQGAPVSIENDFDALSVEEIDLSSSTDGAIAHDKDAEDVERTDSQSVQAPPRSNSPSTTVEAPPRTDAPSATVQAPPQTLYAHLHERMNMMITHSRESPTTLLNAADRNIDIDNAYIGCELMRSAERAMLRDIYLNVEEPFCAVICGLQSTGKSNTTTVLSEACMTPCPEPADNPIVKLKSPGIALAFVASPEWSPLLHLQKASSSHQAYLDKSSIGVRKVYVIFHSVARFALLEPQYKIMGYVCLMFHSLFQGDDLTDLVTFIEQQHPGTLILVDTCDLHKATEQKRRLYLTTVLSAFLISITSSNKVLILDDAHEYLSPSLCAEFCRDVISAIRRMTFENLRVIVSTYSPMSIPVELLEELTICFMHRFQSERWYDHVRRCFLNSATQLPPGIFKSLECGEAVLFAKRGEHQQAFPIRIRPALTGSG